MGRRQRWAAAATVWVVADKINDQVDGCSLVRAKTRGLALRFYEVERKK